MSHLSEEQEAALSAHLIRRCSPYAIVLFGSAAKGKLRADSDVDIAYLSDTKLTAYERFIIAQELADLLKRNVDLIDFDEASTVLQAQIVGHRKLLFDTAPVKRQEAFMKALKFYALMNEERAELVKSYRF